MVDQFAEELTGEDLLEELAGIARELADSDSLDETLQRVVDALRSTSMAVMG